MTETRTLDTLAGPRTYLVHVPPEVEGRGPLPLLMFLHGTGGTAAWTLGETRLDATADAHGFLLILPEAMPRARPPSFLDNPPVWNDGAREGPSAGATADDVGFLTAVLDDMGRYSIDPERIYFTGFSNGAAMAFRFASERAERLAGLAAVAGHCWIGPHPGRPVPTLYIIGDSDPLFPLAGGEVVLPWGRTRSQRPPVSWTLERWAKAIGPSVEFRTITVPGLGHHWPGGRGQLSRRLAGQPSDRLDANETIWEFFRHTSARGD